jgi:hypothetical protein
LPAEAAVTTPETSADPPHTNVGKVADPTAPVPVVDDRGKPVLGRDGNQMLRPAGLDPHFFVERGLADRQLEDELIQSGLADGDLMAFAFQVDALSHFGWWGAWDAQRVGGRNRKKYVDYATVAIGLYAAAAGIPRSTILSIEDAAALVRSHFAADTVYDPVYTHLPEDNVRNTDKGYELYRSGAIKAHNPAN